MKNKRSNNATVNTVSATAAAHTLASKAFAVLMSAILVLGLSPITKVSYADTASNTSVTQESSASADQGAGSNAKSAAGSDDEASGKADTKSTSADEVATTTGTAATGASSTAAATASKVASKSASSASDSDTNAAATASANNSTEPASNGEDDIALASDNQNSSIAPGKYGNYTYEQNSTKNAFTSSDYDAYRDSVATQWLGIAGSFHITGFDEVTTSSHIYGNILTKKLSGSNNFGLDSRYDEKYGYKGLSYVQEYPNPAGNVDGHEDGTFVIGSNNTVTTVDNNNHLAINGTQFNQPNKLVQDADTASAPFIDLGEVKEATTKISDDLAKVDDVGASVTNKDGKIEINYEGDSGCAYVTLTAAELNSMNELNVRGMELNGKCSVVINVDMAGATKLDLKKVHVYSPDGKDEGTGEIDSTVGYVMFNIMNSTSDMTISLSDRVLASVLAPNSTINLAGSAAGTYVGTKVNVTAESHARPFRGTLKPVVGDLSVQKVWKDASGKVEEDVDHDPITATVLQRSKAKDGEWSDWAEYETVTLSNDNGWSKSWVKLPKKDTDGTTYEYKIVESDESKAANPDYDSVVTNNGIAWTITNTHKRTAEYTEASVTKAWLAADGTAESDDVVAGHGAVQAQLYKKAAGGEFAPEGEAVTLSKDNEWSHKWEGLVSKDADGTEYEYKVEETDASKAANPDYDSAVTNDGTAWTITNTHKAETTQASVHKAWKDADGGDEQGVEHTAITAELWYAGADGSATEPVKGSDGSALTAVLDGSNGWSGSWEGLPAKDAQGNAISYTVVESDASKAANPDYECAVSRDAEGSWSFTVTNTHKRTAEYTEASVTKAWLAADGTAESDDVVAGHGAVQAQLYKKAAGGEFAPEGEPVTLSKDNSWSHKWEGLVSKDADGTAYEYKVEEAQASKDANPDYDSAVSREGTAWTITNTHKAEEQEFSLSGYSMRAADAPTPAPDKVCYVDPKVVKVLEGRTLTAGEFSFQLIDDLTGGVVSTAVNDEAGMVDFDKAADKTGNPDNPSCLEFTAAGTYSYTVRETPNQVKDSTIEYSTEVVKFVTTIGQNSDGSLYEMESHYVKDGEIYSSSDHPTITNKVKPLSLGLVKSDDTTGVGLEGAVYGLYRVDESLDTGAVQVMTSTSNDKGLMVFTGVDGSAITTGEEYFFQEISAPDGYTVSENKSSIFQIVQASDGTYSLVYPYEASAVAENGIALAAAVEPTVTNGNSGTPTDPIMYKVGTGVSDSKVAITFGKVSSDGTALSGAELAVRDESGTDVSVWTTDGVGHVVDSLVTGKKYVLYEKTAPEGYEKAAEVTFTVDQYGKVVVAEGAEQDGVLNAYAVDSTLNLVDYKQNELVTKKTVVREEGVPTKQVSAINTESTTSSLPKTSDNIPLVPIAVVAGIAVVVLCVAARKRRKQ